MQVAETNERTYMPEISRAIGYTAVAKNTGCSSDT